MVSFLLFSLYLSPTSFYLSCKKCVHGPREISIQSINSRKDLDWWCDGVFSMNRFNVLFFVEQVYLQASTPISYSSPLFTLSRLMQWTTWGYIKNKIKGLMPNYQWKRKWEVRKKIVYMLPLVFFSMHLIQWLESNFEGK